MALGGLFYFNFQNKRQKQYPNDEAAYINWKNVETLKNVEPFIPWMLGFPWERPSSSLA